MPHYIMSQSGQQGTFAVVTHKDVRKRVGFERLKFAVDNQMLQQDGTSQLNVHSGRLFTSPFYRISNILEDDGPSLSAS